MAKESVYFQLASMNGKADAKEIKSKLAAFPGVLSVSVNPEEDNLAVDFDNTGIKIGQIARQLEKLGYAIKEQKNQEHLM